jgi:hypothetical protein
MKNKIIVISIALVFILSSLTNIVGAFKVENKLMENTPEDIVLESSGLSTTFSPPYESDPYTYSEIFTVIGDVDVSANRLTGYIGGSINISGIGIPAHLFAYGIAEAYQVLDFYTGRKKTLRVEAEVIVSVMDIDILAGLSQTNLIAKCDEQLIYNDEIEPLMGLDEWMDLILFIIGFIPEIGIVSYLGTINEIMVFLNYMMGLEDNGATATFDISFNLENLNSGNHQLKLGCFQTSACTYITPVQISYFLGSVNHIKVFGLAPPNKPTISGTQYSNTEEICEFCATSTDSNNDPVQYKFSWGDGQESVWSDFISEGEEFCINYIYSQEGEFEIKAKSRDIDLLESEWSDIHTISIADRETDLKCLGQLTWAGVPPDSTASGRFSVKNIGQSNSKLDWEITEYPKWGSWSFEPSIGTDLRPEDRDVIVDVNVKAPDEVLKGYNGFVKIVNKEDNSDFELIPVVLSTDRIKDCRDTFLYLFLEKLFEQFSAFRILEIF